MADLGKLCYVSGGSALAYNSGESALIYKGEETQTVEYGDITVVVTAEVTKVGPIQGCGNIHDVQLTLNGSTGIGAVSCVVPAASTVLSVTSRSVNPDCAYPAENPSMGFTVIVAQNGNPNTFNVAKSVSNVAEGSFDITLTVGANKMLTGVA